LVAHRREILSVVDLLLVMRGGTAQAFGPRDEVLAKLAPPQQQPPRSDPAVRGGSGGKDGLVVGKKAGQ
jgi:ATP-binding cassette subfamily C protein